MSSGPDLRERARGVRDWLFAFCAACTAWLIVQNAFLIALAWISSRGRL
jgi:hypothetical protein